MKLVKKICAIDFIELPEEFNGILSIEDYFSQFWGDGVDYNFEHFLRKLPEFSIERAGDFSLDFCPMVDEFFWSFYREGFLVFAVLYFYCPIHKAQIQRNFCIRLSDGSVLKQDFVEEQDAALIDLEISFTKWIEMLILREGDLRHSF